MLGFYDVEKKKFEESEFFNFDKVLDISYSDNGQELLMSGVQKGQSDIFVYNLRSRTYDQVTRDLYDDFNPRFVNKSSGIVFSSNRTNDSVFVDPKKQQLPGPTTDIFYYDYKGRSSVFTRITSTPDFNETMPIPYDSGFAYLSDESGIINRYTATLDSVLSFVDTVEHYRPIVKTIPQTDYARNIINHELNQNKHILTETIYKDSRYYMYASDLATRDITGMNPKNTLYRNQSLTKEKPVEKESTRRPVKITELIDSSLSDIKLDGVLDVPDSESKLNPKTVPKSISTITYSRTCFQNQKRKPTNQSRKNRRASAWKSC
jgi:Tol biopolymer transport system component